MLSDGNVTWLCDDGYFRAVGESISLILMRGYLLRKACGIDSFNYLQCLVGKTLRIQHPLSWKTA